MTLPSLPGTPPQSANRAGLMTVRTRLLLFLFVGIAALVLIQIVLQLSAIQQENETQIRNTLRSNYEQYLNTIELEGRTAASTAVSIAGRDDIRPLIEANDHEGLLALMQPTFDQLRAQYNVDHLYFHDAAGTVIVRLHSPAQFGDNVTSRRSIADAIALRQPTQGIELGATFLGVRGVAPVMVGDALIGLVETGIDIDTNFIAQLSANINADFTFWLQTNVGEVSNFNMEGRPFQSPLDSLFFYSGSRTTLLPVSAEDFTRLSEEGDSQFVNVNANNVGYAVTLSPLLGYNNRLMGVVEIGVSTQAQTEALQANQLRIFLISAVLLIAALGIFWWIFSRLVITPLYKLEGAMQRYQGGNLAARVPDLGKNEFGNVATTYNEMIENVNALLESEKASVKEKEGLIRQLKETSRFKDEFLAVMSHELRTPLNAIIGLLGIINMTGKIDDNSRLMIRRARANSERLLSLINNILDISRMEAGRLQIVPSEFSLHKLVGKVQQDMGVLAEQKGLVFNVEIASNIPETLYMDEDALNKILVNLVGNAFKFTETGSVSIDIQKPQESLIISVNDTGVGIPQHMQDVIFESFRQADGSSTRSHGGTGLGLAIVRNLCQAMNGAVRLNSTPGKGSTFIVTLPVSAAPDAKYIGEELSHEVQHV